MESKKTQKIRIPRDRGVDTFGRPIRYHVDVINETYEAYMKNIKDIRNYLLSEDLKGQDKDWKKKNFAVISLTPYCKLTSDKLVPAEFGIVVFSFDEGVKEIHSGFFETGEIPFAETGEVTLNCEINGLPFPGRNEVGTHTPAKFMEIVYNLTNKFGLFMGNQYLFFAPRFDKPFVNCCLAWIAFKADKEMSMFKILSFEKLLMEMSLRVDDPKNVVGVITHEGGAAKFIRNTRYDFLRSLACNWHKNGSAADKLDRCTQNISLRQVYNALFYLCHLFKREITPMTHVPFA